MNCSIGAAGKWRRYGYPNYLDDLRGAQVVLVPDRNLRARVACISAIRNGKELDSQTMNQIVQDWQTLQNPHTCPHGRPIYFFLGKQQLARFFRRP